MSISFAYFLVLSPSNGATLKQLDFLRPHADGLPCKRGSGTMFDSLNEQMKHDRREQKTMKEWGAQLAVIFVVAIVVFGGLHFLMSKF